MSCHKTVSIMEKINDEDKHKKDEGIAKTGLKTMGRTIHLPPIKSIFPLKRNSLQEPEEVRAMSQLNKEFTSMSDKHFSKIKDIYIFTQFFHPFVDNIHKYVILCRIMQLFFVIDDHIECGWGQIARNNELDDLIWDQIDECFERLIDGTNRISMAEWKPYVVALYICFEDVFKEYNLVQKKRAARTYKDWGIGNKIEGQLIRANYQYKNIEEYLEVRKYSIGSNCVLAMIEFADNIQLTDEEWEVLTNYVHHIGCLVTMGNDLQSYEKESIEHKDDPDKMTNAVALIIKWNDCSLEEALEKLVDIFKEYENRTKQIQSQLLDRPNLSQDMEKFIDRAQYLIAGNLFAGLYLLQRYCEVSEVD